MKVVLSNPVVNTNVKNAVQAFFKFGMLKKFVTSFCFVKGSILSNFKGLSGREFKGLKQTKIARNIPWFLFHRLIALFAKCMSISYSWVTRLYLFHDSLVARRFLENSDIIYGYEDSCADTFAKAKKAGIFCVYELPIMYYREHKKIIAEELEKFPIFKPYLPILEETEHKIHRKEKELELADLVIVASLATKKSLTNFGFNEKKIAVIPYGAPIDYMFPDNYQKDVLFRAIFVGSICPRKGVHYLIEAWKSISSENMELILVGEMAYPDEWVKMNRKYFTHYNRLPHSELVKLYQSSDVFVFPSLVEGFGLVILEAMACGLPVITTENTAGPDVITEGFDGFIIPLRDSQGLAEKILWCSNNRSLLRKMSKNARKKAEFYSWESYQATLVNTIKKAYFENKNQKASKVG
jgi:glycosyltransferase involved in cell wall biosynthesis